MPPISGKQIYMAIKKCVVYDKKKVTLTRLHPFEGKKLNKKQHESYLC